MGALRAFRPPEPGAADQDRAPETGIARHMALHACWIAPAVVAVAALLRGWGGALGAALALAVVVANFLLAASLLQWAGRISPSMVAVAAFGGYVSRMAVITVVLLAVRNVSAVDFATFGIVLVVTHLGLLFWELRSVSLTLGAPGLRPVNR